MPQRKDYDVYAGNQKVGEIWSEHPTKTDYESEINNKMYYNQHIRHEMGFFSSRFYAKEKRMKFWGVIRTIIGVAAVLGAIFIVFKVERNGWQDCILPSVLLGVGVALVKSSPITSYHKEDIYIDKGEVAKGFLGGGLGLFAVLAILHYAGDFAKDFFGL